MSECELCGSKEATRKTKIDKAILTVCDRCVSFGEEVNQPQIVYAKKMMTDTTPGYVLKKNFNALIRNSRDKMKLTQDDLAKKLKEKLSIIKRIEEGWEPSPILISKLEKFFNIELKEETEERISGKKSGKEELTIGDIAEIR
jgi:putative transcription factor